MKTPQDRQILIDRLETFSSRSPGSYKLRVMLVAALGYSYLLAVVVALLGFVYVVIWAMIIASTLNGLLLKVLWIPLVLAWLVLRSMWVTIPAPDGKEIHSDQAPELFAVIAEVRASLAGPAVHHVLLCDEFNAGIVQVPRFGMFGWCSNYLVIGLPLLKAVGPDELRAVLAHEFGHLSGKHGRFSGWVYRIRQSWIQLLTNVQRERHYASFIFEWFIKWYAPYFNAYSFVLARAQEYEADQYAVEMAGQALAARTLVHIEAKTRALQEEVWPQFYHQAADQPNAPKNPFTFILNELEQPLAAIKVEKWLRQSLRVQTGYDDTHPALAQRLEAIGFALNDQSNPSLIDTLGLNDRFINSAAEQYLNEPPQEITDSYDRLWREQVVTTWRQTHDHIQRSRKRLGEIEEASTMRSLTIDEQWERAKCTAETKDAETALPFVREMLVQEPNHVGANFALGASLIERQDHSGVEYLQKAVALDPSVCGEACELLSSFYQTQGQPSEAEKYRGYAEEFYDRQQRLYEQATNLTVHDRFEPHGLDEIALQHLQEQLAKTRGLGGAYLVCKVIDANEWFYVLAVLATDIWKRGKSGKYVGDLIDELARDIDLSKFTVFISLDAKPFLINAITAVPNSQVYLRDSEVGMEYRH